MFWFSVCFPHSEVLASRPWLTKPPYDIGAPTSSPKGLMVDHFSQKLTLLETRLYREDMWWLLSSQNLEVFERRLRRESFIHVPEIVLDFVFTGKEHRIIPPQIPFQSRSNVTDGQTIAHKCCSFLSLIFCDIAKTPLHLRLLSRGCYKQEVKGSKSSVDGLLRTMSRKLDRFKQVFKWGTGALAQGLCVRFLGRFMGLLGKASSKVQWMSGLKGVTGRYRNNFIYFPRIFGTFGYFRDIGNWGRRLLVLGKQASHANLLRIFLWLWRSSLRFVFY
ncbi:uncharacterized protein BDR25DRAFT_356801 [Lindgomyces ingoldianus]|uniref:Uncharacterized protein n=1 Tax=Lindgomyces ingoldianus TaxID=673940 RepID=A0ACB6QQA3_9PLEO|nr:uncharacterized protein BDR25DRAFT_356801 [Lindgomyces ingoldianus]KAF2469037.1 hypothetical protein BDR25DRAFT_356801 [Lindgomyces ingoldianus]